MALEAVRWEVRQMDPRADVTLLVGDFDDRASAIITDRLGAASGVSLDELGQRFGVSRERIRQVEAEIRGRLASFPWVIVMAGLLPVHGAWVRHVDDLRVSAPELFEPLGAFGVTRMDLLAAAGEVSVARAGWVTRGMEGERSSWWDRLVEAGRSSVVSELNFRVALAEVGLAGPAADRWMREHDFVVAHGVVCPAKLKLDEFLILQFRAIGGGPVDIEVMEEWIQGQWSPHSMRNLVQADGRFTRTDRSSYALAELGLPEYRGIRESITDLLLAAGPMPLDEVIEKITGRFSVSAKSVRTFAGGRSFRIKDGVISLREDSRTGSSRPRQVPGLVDLPEGRRWRGLFFTQDGFALRFVVNADHLRGSGWNTGEAIARVVGVREGEDWKCAFTNVPGELKVYRNDKKQPSFGSVKKALEAIGAAEGDVVFMYLYGEEGAIYAAEIRRMEQASDPFSRALALVGATDSIDDPFAALNAALGVDAEFAQELVDIAAGRRDELLVEALAEIASL